VGLLFPGGAALVGIYKTAKWVVDNGKKILGLIKAGLSTATKAKGTVPER
jgi:hypothetical protein